MKHMVHILLLGLALAAGCAPDSAPATGPVTITVKDSEGTPRVGMIIAFHEPDGTPTTVAVTNADGRVTGTITEGGMATIALRPSALATMAGIQPGDELLFQETPAPPLEILGTVDVALPGVAVPNAVTYLLDVGCYAASSSDNAFFVSLNVARRCTTSAGTFSVLATAYSSGGQLMGYNLARGLSVPTLGATVTVDLGGWTTDLKELPVEFSNADAEALAAGVAQLEIYLDGIPFAINSQNIGFFSSGTSKMTILIPPESEGVRGAWGVFYGAGLTEPESLGVSFRDYVESLPASVQIDVAKMPARISDYTFDTTDPNRPKVTFTAHGSLAGADLAVFLVASTSAYWLVASPPGATHFRYPELPEELSAWRPNASTSTAHEMFVVDSDYIAGYDDARINFGLGMMMNVTDRPPPNPAGGDSITEIILAGNTILSQL